MGAVLIVALILVAVPVVHRIAREGVEWLREFIGGDMQ